MAERAFLWPNRIRAVRKRAGLSQAKLGAACMPVMSASQVGKREKGETAVTLDNLEDIARVLRCHPGELLKQPEIDEAERAFVGVFRSLPEPDRRTLLRVADAFGKSPDRRHDAPPRLNGGRRLGEQL